MSQQENPAKSVEHPPCHTLYLKNLNERLKLDDLKQTLYYVFAKFGKVLSIHAKKNIHMRGQAFIVFEKMEDAIAAMKKINGKLFFNKKLVIQFAKEESDVVLKMKGKYVKKERPGYKCVPMVSGKPGKKKVEKRVRQVIVNTKPNKVLFVEDLPPVKTDTLIQLFQNYPGFKEVRYFAPKKCAFVEFDDEFQSGIALTALRGYKLTDSYPMNISYAKS